MPNEGKSSIAINLWKMLAEAGFPTVLVDVDLRKSVIKRDITLTIQKSFRILDIISPVRQR